MDTKKIRKDISRFLAWLGLNLCYLTIKIIPDNWLCGFAQGVSRFGYLVARKQRNIALESLKIAFGQDKTKQEIAVIAKNCFSSMAKAGVELISMVDRPLLLKERVGIIGKENLDSALVKGKGVILVSAHFGNFPLILARLSLEGYETTGIIRQMRDARTEKMFTQKRKQMGIKIIYSYPRRACVENAIRVLRKNELLFIPLDQNFGTGGVFVDFFGRKAATATGPVVLAQRTKASIISCFIIRQPDDTHKIIFEPVLELKEGRTSEETAIINIQRLTDIIEAYIRKYPAEWGWIHRRWKSKPS